MRVSLVKKTIIYLSVSTIRLRECDIHLSKDDNRLKINKRRVLYEKINRANKAINLYYNLKY